MNNNNGILHDEKVEDKTRQKGWKKRFDKCKTIDKKDQAEDGTTGLTHWVYGSEMSLSEPFTVLLRMRFLRHTQRRCFDFVS